MTWKLALFFLHTSFIFASADHYLPIQTPIASDVEKLAALTAMPSAKKPYTYHHLHHALKQIKTTHPTLHRRIHRYLTLTYSVRAGVRQTSHQEALLFNQYGASFNEPLYGGGRFYYATDYGVIEGDVTLEGGEERTIAQPNSFYLGVGIPYFRVEYGYKPRYYSPFHDGAAILSTHAKTPLSLGVVNTTPLPWLGINYELFSGILEEQNGIFYQHHYGRGAPKLLGLHLSGMLSHLEFGFNRVFMYGGNHRPEIRSPNDFINALINPNGVDNTTNELTADEEFGNQLGSITLQAHLKNTTFYWELAAEDTSGNNPFYFGNTMARYGLFIPELTPELSLRYELSELQNGWYTHHLYRKGYRNQNKSLGHWIADSGGYQTEADVHYLACDYELNGDAKLSSTLRYIDGDRTQFFATFGYHTYGNSWTRTTLHLGTLADESHYIGGEFEWEMGQ